MIKQKHFSIPGGLIWFEKNLFQIFFSLNNDFFAFKYWIDQGISWNPNSYGGITSIRLLASQIWTPGK